MMNLESMDLGEAFKNGIKAARDDYEKIRDRIADGDNGETQAAEAEERLGTVKRKYIDMYYSEHQKRRLGVNDGKRKGDLVSSMKLANLKRLKAISILSGSKLSAIENDLAAMKVCYELTPEMLKTSSFCPKCGFHVGENSPAVKGALDAVEEKIDVLWDEWTSSLYYTVSDPQLTEQKGFLKHNQLEAIDDFVKAKSLPEVVDLNFINAITELLRGFEPLAVSIEEMADKLGVLGPLDVDTFKAKVCDFADTLAKGKDKNKLRIILKK